MKFQPQKHIRMLTVNSMQGSAITDTIPDIQLITPIIRELSLKEEVIALLLSGSVARGQARSISDIDLLHCHTKGPVTVRSMGSPQLWI
jgi:predicted nucleotidyltransferase